jgi:hypothetical protein
LENHPTVSVVAEHVVVTDVRRAVEMVLFELWQYIYVTMISHGHDN